MPEPPAAGTDLRLLSWNIQVGVNSARFSHYVTQSWKHVVPHGGRVTVMDSIAALLARFDVVALQETDSGSLRTGFVNQTEYLAERAGFGYWVDQTTRRLGRFARHANGLLSRLPPETVEVHPLPGLPGRGLMHARYGQGDGTLNVFVLHLALGRRGRERQLAFLGELLAGCRHAVVMGDLNCTPDSLELRALLARVGLRSPMRHAATFPSWRPRRHIDHVLVSAGVEVRRAWVPDWLYSDHLPIAVEAHVPLALPRAGSRLTVHR